MKKITLFVLIFIIIIYELYQNGSLWILKAISLFSNSSTNIPNLTSSSIGPPFKDGIFTGSSENAFYGNVQIKASIQNGKITSVTFLQYPNDRTRSMAINTLAMPNLEQEAIQAQNSKVDIISGATDTSIAFAESLNSALSQAK